MNTKIIIIILVLICVFVIFGYKTNIIGDKNPDIHAKEREKLSLELTTANSIDECKIISEQIVKLGPQCSRSFETWMCFDLGQFYRDYMVSCISNMAIKENNQKLCINQSVNEEICIRWAELADFPFDEPSKECLYFVEKECIFSLASDSDIDVELNCDSYEEDYERDECFSLLATTIQDSNICLNISNEYSQSDCMYYFALRNHDFSLCQYGVEGQKKDCEDVLNLIKNLDDSNECANVDSLHGSSPGDKECYLAYAIYNKDSTLCSKYKGRGPFINNICERYTK